MSCTGIQCLTVQVNSNVIFRMGNFNKIVYGEALSISSRQSQSHFENIIDFFNLVTEYLTNSKRLVIFFNNFNKNHWLHSVLELGAIFHERV